MIRFKNLALYFGQYIFILKINKILLTLWLKLIQKQIGIPKNG